MILVSGYSIPMRARIVDRWEALETGKAVPAVSGAARAAEDMVVLSALADALRLEGSARLGVMRKGKPELFGYTLPKSALGKRSDKKKIQPAGYKHTECLIDADGEAIDGTVCKRRSGHIPCNARASNEYASKVVMVHAYDRHPNVSVTNYLRVHGVEFSKERFAINELVQWLWRSAIRNGQPIHVAILSKRMRELFLAWLDS